jgi:hypothetical protein
MNKSDVQHSAQSAPHAQDHTATSKHGAARSSSSKPAVKPEAEPNAHVCTDACTHAGATKGVVTSAEKSGAKAAPAAPKTSNEAVAMGSPEFGLGGRPVPKDAVAQKLHRRHLIPATRL